MSGSGDASSASAFDFSASDVARFERDGFLVLPGFWPPATTASVRAAAERLLDAYDPAAIPRSIFTTDEQQRHSDDYFLASGDAVSFFFEAAAVDPATGALLVPKRQAINKIGHNLHEREPAFRAVSLGDARVAAICRRLGFRRPLVAQSMHIVKPPLIGGAVRPHVDGAFLATAPQSVLGLWWPCEDCTTRNGCLWAVPGSHRRAGAEAPRRFRRRDDGRGTEFTPREEGAPFDLSGAVPLEIAAGSLVLLHAALVHFSEANSSDAGRHAYSIHVVEGAAGTTYLSDNWLQRPGGPSAFPALYDDSSKEGVDGGSGGGGGGGGAVAAL
jgi:phytanoyl-CoA hydroxylase